MSRGDRQTRVLAECLSVSDGHYIVLEDINSKIIDLSLYVSNYFVVIYNNAGAGGYYTK